ncbi:dipeptidase [Planctomycetota bacterium]|nr:dipeptidase [Planctomycetota bacterium]
MKYADAHADTFYEVALKGLSPVLEDGGLHVNLPRMRQVGQVLQCCSVFTPARYSGPEAEKFARNIISTLDEWVRKEPSFIKTTCVDDLDSAPENSVGLIPWLEGASPLRGELSLLDEFYALGVRGIGLVHNHRNEVADGCGCSEPRHGLSPFGRNLIKRMNELGVAMDLAHMPEPGFMEALDVTSAPPIITHTGCRALVNQTRNASDDMLRAIADRDGVVGIDFYPGHVLPNAFRNGVRRATVDDVAKHIAHAVNICGVEHVCIGSDFDGFGDTCESLENASHIPNLIDAIKRKGLSETDCEKVMAENLLRYLGEVLSEPKTQKNYSPPTMA